MTLGRQLFLGISVLFLVALAGLQVIYLRNSQSALQQQLQSHAQDAATTLALRLPQAMGDPALVDTVVSAAFDSGYYRAIRVVSIDGRTVVQKELTPGQGEIPDWFTRLFPLRAPSGQALLSSGWKQLGVVQVTSHPLFAYRQLWRSGIETLGWMLLVYALVLLVMRWFLSSLLRPLHEIETTAHAISERDFRIIERIPTTRELRQAVLAINSLSTRVRGVIESATTAAERFRGEAVLDAVTGLANRRGFMQQVEASLAAAEAREGGLLALIEIQGFAEFNREAGYRRGDEILSLVAAAMQGTDGSVTGRMAGSTFAVAATDIAGAVAERVFHDLCGRVGILLAEQGTGLHFSGGAVRYQRGSQTLSGLLSAADSALAAARAQGRDGFQLQDIAAQAAADEGSENWKQRIEAALAGSDATGFVLHAQPVVSLPGRQLMHREVMVRMLDRNGDTIPADRFLPMAWRHRLMARLDAHILDRLLAFMDDPGHIGAADPFAVNVSPQSMRDPVYLSHLREVLASRPAAAARLVFEVTEFGALQDVAATQSFIAELKRLGAGFAIDNFGLQQDSLRHLPSLLPRYIKLSARQISDLRDNEESRFFVVTLARIAQTLDIGLIAQAVEDESVLPMLGNLGFTGCQGYVSGRPAPLDA